MQSSISFILFSIILYLQVDGILAETSSCKDPNEEYAVDANRPQNTCEYYGCYDQFACRGSSDSGDCYCKQGYARKFQKGPCISIKHPSCARELPPTPEVCQKRENEIWKKYVSNRLCENTCENYNWDCGTISTLVLTWKPWCDCAKGYARLPNGKCVKISNRKCSELYMPSPANCRRRGEVFAVGRVCENTPSCAYPLGPQFICDDISPMSKCYCKEDELRKSSGKCIPEDQCS